VDAVGVLESVPVSEMDGVGDNDLEDVTDEVRDADRDTDCDSVTVGLVDGDTLAPFDSEAVADWDAP
jgi:hypothetical protein